MGLMYDDTPSEGPLVAFDVPDATFSPVAAFVRMPPAPRNPNGFRYKASCLSCLPAVMPHQSL
jgi:hypothetical protein